MVPRPPRRVIVALFVRSLPIAVACGALTPREARADDARLSVDAARDLFAGAEDDEDAGRWEEALAKLRRVAEVKLTPGVRYHVALCEEHRGHLVAAVAGYEAAAAQARAENAADVLRLVDARVADAASRLSALTVFVPGAPDVAVSLDGQAVVPGVAVRADPGAHVLEAVAPGRAPFLTVLAIPERARTSYMIHLEAALAALATAAPPEGAPPARTSAPAGPPVRLGVAAAIAAAVLAGGGAGAYLEAGREDAAALGACAQRLAPSASACDGSRAAVRAWDWAAIGAWGGAAALGAVAVVTLAAPRRASIAVGPASLAIEGSF